MNINLDLLEQDTYTLLETAQSQILENKLEEQREAEYQRIMQDIQSRIPRLLTKVTQTIQAFKGSKDNHYQALIERQCELQETLDNAPYLAAQMADEKMFEQENTLLNQWFQQQLEEQRYEQKAQVLTLISEQTNFHDALDLAITVKGYKQDLENIDALDEVVKALVDQIDRHDRNRGQPGSIGQPRGDAEYTLNFLCEMAQRGRSTRSSPKRSLTKQTPQTSCKTPNPYSDLTGKVLVFGGHKDLETNIRKRLKGSAVELTWCPVDTGLKQVAQTEKQIPKANLIIIMTRYTSHTLTDHVTQAIEKYRKDPIYINRCGMVGVLKTLEFHLKAQKFSQQMGRQSA